MTRAKAIDKTRKLLALARDNGATVAEAKLARERADALIDRYSLHASEYDPPREPPPIPAQRPAPSVGVVYGNVTTGTYGTASTNIRIVFG